MSVPDDRLTARQHAAIAALLTCKTIKSAASNARVGEATLRRWLSNEAFKEAYRAARRGVMDGVISQLQQAAKKAVGTLERFLGPKNGRAADQIRAAIAVMDFATRGLEVGDLLARVEELERLAATEGAPDAAAPPEAGQAGATTPGAS
ncbi:MAG TPA: hypothetical protein VHR66_33085 [Gemmataceae bacterium]|jgi:hypothetical protein|nr:hypothetical protein [Gemmataceae bacterium]